MLNNPKIRPGSTGAYVNYNPPAAMHIAAGGTNCKVKPLRKKEEFTQNRQTFKGI